MLDRPYTELSVEVFAKTRALMEPADYRELQLRVERFVEMAFPFLVVQAVVAEETPLNRPLQLLARQNAGITS